MIIMVVMAIGCYLPVGILPSDSCHHLISKYYDVSLFGIVVRACAYFAEAQCYVKL